MLFKKKIASIFSLVMVSAMVFTSCSSGGNNDNSNSTSTPPSGNEDSNANNNSGQKTKIVYGGWEDPIMASYLAEKFMEQNQDIEIEIFNNNTWLGNENVQKLVAANQMPDIINLENPIYPLQNNWVIDLMPYVEKEGSLDIPKNFIKYGTFNDKLIMIPNAVFLHGIMLNKDLLRSNNIEIPGYDWTIDELSNILKRTTRKGSTVGINEVRPILKHLPSQMNDDLGWAAFNEETKEYQLTPEWVESANIAYDLHKANVAVYERLDENGNPWDLPEGSDDRTRVEEARAQFLQDLIGEAETYQGWLKGKIAAFFEFSWGMKFDNTANNPDYSGFDWDFYPFPVQAKGDVSRPGIVIDSVGITTKCQNPDAAWEFLKFITFSKEGIDTRFEIIENYNKADAQSKFPNFQESQYPEEMTFSFMPCSTNQEIIDRWVDFNDAPGGIKHMMENMDIGYVDGFKVTPGFDDAYHKTIEKALVDQVFTGQKTAADIADEVQSIANEITRKAYEAIQ